MKHSDFLAVSDTVYSARNSVAFRAPTVKRAAPPPSFPLVPCGRLGEVFSWPRTFQRPSEPLVRTDSAFSVILPVLWPFSLFLLFPRVRARWPNVAPTMVCSRGLAVSIRKCGTRRAPTCRAFVTPSGRQRRKARPRSRRGRNCRRKSSAVWKAVETVPAKSRETFSFLFFFDYVFALKQNRFIKKNHTFPLSILLLL